MMAKENIKLIRGLEITVETGKEEIPMQGCSGASSCQRVPDG